MACVAGAAIYLFQGFASEHHPSLVPRRSHIWVNGHFKCKLLDLLGSWLFIPKFVCITGGITHFSPRVTSTACRPMGPQCSQCSECSERTRKSLYLARMYSNPKCIRIPSVYSTCMQPATSIDQYCRFFFGVILGKGS